MRPLGRRSLFALPLVAPAAVVVVDAERAARDHLIAAGKVAPNATPEQALDAFRAERPLLDGKGEG